MVSGAKAQTKARTKPLPEGNSVCALTDVVKTPLASPCSPHLSSALSPPAPPRAPLSWPLGLAVSPRPRVSDLVPLLRPPLPVAPPLHAPHPRWLSAFKPSLPLGQSALPTGPGHREASDPGCGCPHDRSPLGTRHHLLWLEVCRCCWLDLAGVQRGHLSAGGLSWLPQKYSAGAKRPALHRARLLHLVADLSFCRPCLPGDLRLSDSRTRLARGSLPAPSCLAEIQSRVNSCLPTPQHRDENSCLPVRFSLCLRSADVTSRPSSQAPQSRGSRPNSKGGSSRRPPSHTA